MPSGQPVLPGFRRFGCEPHGGSATEATFARNPCIHAGSRDPVVRYNAALGWAKSMAKTAISTIFLGFYAFFARFYRILPGFGRFYCRPTRKDPRP